MTCALLVPCKNGAVYLPRLLASARVQTHPFDEIWLFDDGSQDDSAAVAASLGAKVLRSEESVGPSAARNRLTSACGCEWLHFHDADDTMDPHYVERVLARAGPGIDVVVCDMTWVREDDGQIDNVWTYDGDALTRHPAAYLLLNTIGGINGLYRRRTLLETGGFDEKLRFWEDLDLNLRLAQRGCRTTVVNEPLVTAYRRRTSYSNSNLGEVWRVKLQLMDGLLVGADGHLRTTIAAEAETIADRLATLKAWADVAPALALARKAGGDPPTTRNPALRLLKRAAPDVWTFRLQRWLRRAQSP